MNDDRIVFNKDKLDYVAAIAGINYANLTSSLMKLEKLLDEIINGDLWTGPIHDSAVADYVSAKTEISSVKDNSQMIRDFLKSKSNSFRDVNYN